MPEASPEGGDVIHRDGKHIPHITAPDGKVIEIGAFDTREEAGAAYLAKLAELYPPGPAPKVDPKKHHSLAAADIITKPFSLR
jgi:hypothetical protein